MFPAVTLLIGLVIAASDSPSTLSFEIEYTGQYRTDAALGKLSSSKTTLKGRGWIRGNHARSEVGKQVFLVMDGNYYSSLNGKWRKGKKANFDLSAGALSFIPIVATEKGWKSLPDEAVGGQKCKVFEKAGEHGTTRVWKRVSDRVALRIQMSGRTGTGEVHFRNFKPDKNPPEGTFDIPEESRGPS